MSRHPDRIYIILLTDICGDICRRSFRQTKSRLGISIEPSVKIAKILFTEPHITNNGFNDPDKIVIKSVLNVPQFKRIGKGADNRSALVQIEYQRCSWQVRHYQRLQKFGFLTKLSNSRADVWKKKASFVLFSQFQDSACCLDQIRQRSISPNKRFLLIEMLSLIVPISGTGISLLLNSHSGVKCIISPFVRKPNSTYGNDCLNPGGGTRIPQPVIPTVPICPTEKVIHVYPQSLSSGKHATARCGRPTPEALEVCYG